jgi:hypothetical protein
MLCAVVASLPAIGVQFLYHPTLPHIARLAISFLVFGAVYAWMLLVVLGERQFYFNLIRDIIGTASVKETASLPV